jgi:hypothetical protein
MIITCVVVRVLNAVRVIITVITFGIFAQGWDGGERAKENGEGRSAIL